LQQVDAHHTADIGVYVRDLDTGVAMSHRAEERWYLASTIKVIVAITLLRAVEAGTLTLDQAVTLEPNDIVDGAGDTASYTPGSTFRVRHLLEQMIVYSDNTASDMLIRTVGLEKVNALIQDLVPNGFGRITTLADVRRNAWSNVTPAATSLSGKDFLFIKRQQSDVQRLKAVSLLLHVPTESFRPVTVTQAFEAYYATGLNSARLDAYGQLLALLAQGRTLSAENTAYLLDVMSRIKTGAQRMRAGLPTWIHFAHKTGTQRARFCDSGVMSTAPEFGGRRVVVAACTRGDISGGRSDRALREVGEAICRSGIFSTEGTHALNCQPAPSAPSQYDAAER
jgi:beta-lactamase class A